MTLLDIRKQVVKNSGRYDLVTNPTDWADNGMDFYINSAIHMLEKLAEIGESKARLFYPLSAGEYSLTFQHNCRLISDVWINDGETRTRLKKISLEELKALYPNPALTTENGTPLYYALADLRALETTARDSLAIFIDKTNDESDAFYDYRGIVITPPADKDYVVEVSGLFKQVNLSNDADENFWTLQEDDLLIRTTMYKLEAFSRGTENAKNWLSAIREDVFEINKDVAQEESVGITQMEG